MLEMAMLLPLSLSQRRLRFADYDYWLQEFALICLQKQIQIVGCCCSCIRFHFRRYCCRCSCCSAQYYASTMGQRISKISTRTLGHRFEAIPNELPRLPYIVIRMCYYSHAWFISAPTVRQYAAAQWKLCRTGASGAHSIVTSIDCKRRIVVHCVSV